MGPSDTDAWITGDENAWRDVFQKHYPTLVAFANKILRDEDASRDAVQNVFVKLFSQRETIDIRESLSAYLYGAVRNECLTHLKRETRIQSHHSDIAGRQTEAFFRDAIEETERESRIFRAIENLPPQCRKIFVMSRLEERKNADIAGSLGISIRTVETQISNALKALRKALLTIITL